MAALRNAFITALIALGLAAPMMGLVTVQGPNGLRLEPHWERVAIAVGLVFLGRLALNLTIWRPDAGRTRTQIPPRVEATLARLGRWLPPSRSRWRSRCPSCRASSATRSISRSWC